MGKQSRRERKIGKEAREEPKKGPNTAVILVGVLVVLAVGYFGLTGGAPRGMATVPIQLEGVDDADALTALATPKVAGDPDAPITITEFADFQCPGCRRFHSAIKPQVDANLVETGIVQFVFYDFPLTTIHAHAFLAARAARCADEVLQGQFWPFHDMLFAQQDQWAYTTSPAGLFESFAGQLGLDVAAFNECLGGSRFADVVTAQMELGRQLQVPSTPTVIVSATGPGGQTIIERVDRVLEGYQFVEQAVENVRRQAGLLPTEPGGEGGDR